MSVRRLILSLALLTILSLSIANSAYGHGLGEDQALSVPVGEKQLTVMAKIAPASVPIDSSAKPTLLIRAFNVNNNATVSGVDYRLVVELQNETLLEQRFRSSDGVILANLVPDGTIKGWQIAGHESASPEDQVDVSQASPVELRSKILAKGGLYHLAVLVEKGSAGISLQNDIEFDLYVSIAHSLHFEALSPEGEQDIVVKTYYDDVEDFSYDNGTITFSMPFNWDPNYVNLVSLLHMEVQFPKAIEKLKGNSYSGSLNGIDLPPASILIDDYSSEQTRIVHFVVPRDRLSGISGSLEDGTSSAIFALSAADRPRFPLDLLSVPREKYLLQLSWGPDVIETGIPITFVMALRDSVTDDLVRNPAFDFVLTQGGTEIYRHRLQSGIGTFADEFTFSTPGIVTLSAGNINGENESVKIDLVVLQGTGNPAPQPPQKPSGCLIATAAFGSELSPQVQYLRNFREHYILSTAAGSAFMNTFNSAYYSFSPQVADYERDQPWLQSTVKAGLYPLFGILMLSERAHFGAGGGEAGAIASGSVAGMLIGAVYLWPAGFAVGRRIASKWICLSITITAVFLVASVFALPSLLPLSTAAFVLVVAASGALVAAKSILWTFSR